MTFARSRRWFLPCVVCCCAVWGCAKRDAEATNQSPSASAASAASAGAATEAGVVANATFEPAADPLPADPGKVPPEMVAVPGAAFTMGDDGDKTASPAHVVRVTSFLIDRTEVTVKAYQNCVRHAVCTPALLHGPEITEADHQRFGEMCNANHADRLNHPINCVDQSQAALYCAFVDKRLPTEAEWELAARGGDGRRYPWGNDAPGCDRAVVQGCGPNAKTLSGTRPVQTFASGASPVGAFDMAGNVYEWVWDGYDPGAYANGNAIDPARKPEGELGVVRGGSWDFAPVRLSATYRQPFRRATGHVSVGFRCAKNGVPRARPPKVAMAAEPVNETLLSSEDFKPALKATGLKRKGERVVNPCGVPVEPQFEVLHVGGEVEEVIVIGVGGPAKDGAMECSPGGHSFVVRRQASTKRFEVVLESPGIASLHSSQNLGVRGMLLGGPGFCHGVWRWAGKAYEFWKQEGPSCELLAGGPDTEAANSRGPMALAAGPEAKATAKPGGEAASEKVASGKATSDKDKAAGDKAAGDKAAGEKVAGEKPASEKAAAAKKKKKKKKGD